MAVQASTVRECAPVRGRLAPSPTGLLHLGNAWAFFMAWLLCRKEQGSLVLRMEDIDPQRSRREFAEAVIQDLHWLGLDWDEGPNEIEPTGTGGGAPYVQSLRQSVYEQVLRRLDAAGLLYPCFCTRKELRSLAGAPHVGDEGAPYPGTCRELTPQQRELRRAAGRRPALRLRCPEVCIAFTDGIQGAQWMTPSDWGGDFALQRSDGVVAYQLAVAVDDGMMRISQVVRGRDILSSTPRQILLFRLLGFSEPQYLHLPLVCDSEGERLAKRHQGLSLRSLREEGVSAQALLGYLAWKAGLTAEPAPIHPHAFLDRGIVFPGWWKQRDIMLDAEPIALLRRLG